MWLLLFIPVFFVLVLVFSVHVLFAGLFWVLGAAWPVLLIALGAWMFLHDGDRHSRRERWGHAPRPLRTNAWAEHQSTGKRAAAAQDARQPRGPELPVDIEVKVQQIRNKVDVLLSYADRFPPFSQDLYLVRQTASDYLPRTIDAYLALSKQSAGAGKPLTAEGSTAYRELKSQLELLDSKLDDIAQDLERQDSDRMLANRRFLEARFGTRTAKPVAEPAGGR